jgi:hypothetical protein
VTAKALGIEVPLNLSPRRTDHRIKNNSMSGLAPERAGRYTVIEAAVV